MRMKKQPPKKLPQGVALENAIHELLAVTLKIASVLNTSSVASDAEREEVEKSLEKVTAVMREVLSRTSQLTEDVSLYKLNDIETGTKWKGEGQNLEWVVEMASVMLGRLRNKGHISLRTYHTLYRFWLQVVVQHEQLYDRWERARHS